MENISSTFVKDDIARDGDLLKLLYKDSSYLSSLDSKAFLAERNTLVLSFICGAAQIQIAEQSNTTFLYAIAVTVEMIYLLRNQNVILPHCFMMNLVQSFISGSKIVSTINGKSTPCASYTTYKKWICDRGLKPNVCPKGDVITFFDNMGKYIIKDYRVLSTKKQTADVITATLHFLLPESDI